MINKQYEVCLIDRNILEDILNKLLPKVYSKDKDKDIVYDISYSIGKKIPALNIWIRNTININLKYKLSDEETKQIIETFEFICMTIPECKNVEMGSSGSGNSVLFLEFECKLIDPYCEYQIESEKC